MNKPHIYLIILSLFLFLACDKEDLNVDAPTDENPQQIETRGGCSASLFCIPPIRPDTTCVQMQMKLCDNFYKPVANYACIIPNFILGIDQLWINGSIPGGNEVVTLLMPTDIKKGRYPIQNNSVYDAFYVPTLGADNFVAISGELVIVEHDTINNSILGGFEFIAKNLQSAVLPQKDFEEGCFQARY